MDKCAANIKENHWPDADMLPLGHLSQNGNVDGPDRMSRFTMEETYTVLSLWALARSPLIMGGDLLTTPASVLNLLKNREFIALDQHSLDNHRVFGDSTQAIWMARDATGEIDYLGLFNLEGKPRPFEVSFKSVPGLKGKYNVHYIWKDQDLGAAQNRIRVDPGPHGARLFKLTEAR